MADIERAIGITSQLYRCRNAARTLLGDRYDARMKECGELIRKVSTGKNITDLKAAIALGQAAQDTGNDFLFLEVMAAYVELAEPKPSKPEDAHG